MPRPSEGVRCSTTPSIEAGLDELDEVVVGDPLQLDHRDPARYSAVRSDQAAVIEPAEPVLQAVIAAPGAKKTADQAATVEDAGEEKVVVSASSVPSTSTKAAAGGIVEDRPARSDSASAPPGRFRHPRPRRVGQRFGRGLASAASAITRTIGSVLLGADVHPAVGPVEPESVAAVGRGLGVRRRDPVPERSSALGHRRPGSEGMVLDHREIAAARRPAATAARPVAASRSSTRAMATKLSRTNPTRGSITPPFPSPPRTAALGPHPLDDVDLADRSAVDRAAERRGELFGRPRGREVHDHGARRPGRADGGRPGRGSAPRRCSGPPRRRSPAGRRRGLGRTRPPRRSAGTIAAKAERLASVGSGGWSYRPSGTPPSTIGSHPSAPEQGRAHPAARRRGRRRGRPRNLRRRIASTSTMVSTRPGAPRRGLPGRGPGPGRPRAPSRTRGGSRRSSMARPAAGARTIPPGWKNFRPLYSGGLCEAEIWMPPAAPWSRTRRPIVGVAAGADHQGVAARRRHPGQRPRGRRPAPRPGRRARRRSAPARTAPRRPRRTRPPSPGRAHRRRPPAAPTRSRSASRPPMSPSPALGPARSPPRKDSRAEGPAPSRGWPPVGQLRGRRTRRPSRSSRRGRARPVTSPEARAGYRSRTSTA